MKESDIQDGILQYLSYRFPKAYFWRQNTLPIPIRKKQGGKWVHVGFRPALTPGVSDIIGCLKGRMIAIEVKKPGGKLTDNQVAFLDRVNGAGGTAFVAYSIEDVQKELG